MLRNEFWIISTLISVGVIGGFLYNRPNSVVHGSNDPPPDQHSSSNSPDQDGHSGLEDSTAGFTSHDTIALGRLVNRSDELLKSGNFQDSLAHYQFAYRYRRHDAALAFRIGLACELARKPAEAEFFYQRCLVSGPGDGNRQLAAVLGLCRSQIMRDQHQLAAETLCENYLARADDRRLHSELRAQLGYQLAEVLRQKSEQWFATESSVLDKPVFADCAVDIAAMLAAVDETSLSQTHDSAPDEVIAGRTDAESTADPMAGSIDPDQPLTIVQRPTDDVMLMSLRGFTPTIPVTQLLEQIAGETRLPIPLSVNIQPWLVGRTAKVRATAIPVAILMDCLLQPLGLVWFQVDQTIKIVPSSEVEPEPLNRLQLQQATRLAQQTVLNYPDGRCRDAMRLSEANLNFLGGEIDAASAMLRQLDEEQPGGELAAHVRLNLGLLEKKLYRYESATKLLLGAVDQATSNRTKAIAYANLARTNISQDSLQPAIAAASRSLSLTDDLNVRRPAALDLARAYLLAGNQLSANQALFDHADAFEPGIERSLAMVYGAYARSLATLSPLARNKAVETLVIALADIDIKQLPTTADRILVSRAYMHVGLLENAIGALTIPGSEFENPVWQRRRSYELATMLRQNRDFIQAVEILSRLADDRTDLIGQQSLLQWAGIELEQFRNHEKCLELCRSLWRFEMTDHARHETLKLMGRAYQLAGNNHSAAYCFLGILPESDSGEPVSGNAAPSTQTPSQ